MIEQLENAPTVAYEHFSAYDKAKLCAIKGEFPNFAEPGVYDAYWDTMGLIESGEDAEISKLLQSLTTQLNMQDQESPVKVSESTTAHEISMKYWSDIIRRDIGLIQKRHDGLDPHFYKYITEFAVDLLKNIPSSFSYKDCTIEILDKYKSYIGEMTMRTLKIQPEFREVVGELNLMFERLYIIMDKNTCGV